MQLENAVSHRSKEMGSAAGRAEVDRGPAINSFIFRRTNYYLFNCYITCANCKFVFSGPFSLMARRVFSAARTEPLFSRNLTETRLSLNPGT
jgi:hypothetical protein